MRHADGHENRVRAVILILAKASRCAGISALADPDSLADSRRR